MQALLSPHRCVGARQQRIHSKQSHYILVINTHLDITHHTQIEAYAYYKMVNPTSVLSRTSVCGCSQLKHQTMKVAVAGRKCLNT